MIGDKPKAKERKAQTGLIWGKSVAERAQTVRRVCEVFEENYGRPRLGNPSDPLDDLIYIVLSNRTAPGVAQHVYDNLKSKFDSWDKLLASSITELTEILKPAGLAVVKSQQIWAALRKIEHDSESCDLGWLRNRSEGEIQDYLVSLPGVSLKVAKCVMLYTLGVEVLPVDSHVHRVTKRLAWNDRKRADQCHDAWCEIGSPPH